MDPREITAMEEELKKDLDALTRVRRIMESRRKETQHSSTGPGLPVGAALINNGIAHGETNTLEDAFGSSLIARVAEIIDKDPRTQWTTQLVLTQLEQTGFPLRAKKPVYSVGQAINKLVEQGRIRMLKKGAGRIPNLYVANKADESSPENNGFNLTATVNHAISSV